MIELKRYEKEHHNGFAIIMADININYDDFILFDVWIYTEDYDFITSLTFSYYKYAVEWCWQNGYVC